MKLIKSFLFVIVICIFTNVSMAKALDVPQKDSVTKIMRKVCDWQLEKGMFINQNSWKVDWVNGAFYAGLMACYETTGDQKYLQYMVDIGNEVNWKLGPRLRHADDHTVGQAYIECYAIYKNPQMIADTIVKMDQCMLGEYMKNPFPNRNERLDYWWCDALFMGPPVWAGLSVVTGDQKYLDFGNKQFWLSYDLLYDKEESLFARDVRFQIKPDGTGNREKNGEKIFWSRGNGWVMGGLVRTLNYMPASYPDRPKYIKLYREMSERIISIQREDGLWGPALLDKENWNFGESSGSGFYCYALAWGINRGILDRDKYLPAVLKAWDSLCGNVLSDGTLGYVQRIGDSPDSVDENSTQDYGTGAFLLAGSEIIKLESTKTDTISSASIELSNPNDFELKDELITIPLSELEGVNSENCLVKLFGSIVPAQASDLDFDGVPDSISFLIDMEANQKILVTIEDHIGDIKPFVKRVNAEISLKSMLNEDVAGLRVDGGKFVSLKSLDRIATPIVKSTDYRYEGPLIESENVAYRLYWDSRGAIDVFGKISKDFLFNSHQSSKSHHTMQSWGRDLLHNGNALGVGGCGFGTDIGRVSPGVAEKSKIIIGDNGPIRASYRIVYSGIKINGKSYDANLDISMSAGKNYILQKLTVTNGGSTQIMAALTNHTDEVQLSEKLSLDIKGEYDWTGTWGAQVFADEDLGKASQSNEMMGLGLLWPGRQLHAYKKNDTEFEAVFNSDIEFNWASLVAYNQEVGSKIDSDTTFFSYMRQLAKKFSNPVNMKIFIRDDVDVFTKALRNGEKAVKAFSRSNKYRTAWQKQINPVIKLIPDKLNSPQSKWLVSSTAANNYSALISCNYFLSQDTFRNEMLEILRAETILTSRIKSIPDDYDFSTRDFVRKQFNAEQMIDGAICYAYDGLIPIAEMVYIGPYSKRLKDIIDHCLEIASIETPYGRLISEKSITNGKMLRSLLKMYWMTGKPIYLVNAKRIADYYFNINKSFLIDFENGELDEKADLLIGICELYMVTKQIKDPAWNSYSIFISEILDSLVSYVNSEDFFKKPFFSETSNLSHIPKYRWGSVCAVMYKIGLLENREESFAVLDRVIEKVSIVNYSKVDEENIANIIAVESAIINELIDIKSCVSESKVDLLLDQKINNLAKYQDESGLVTGESSDGFFANVNLRYALLMTKNLTLVPWNEDLIFGAEIIDNEVYIVIKSNKQWSGEIIFDTDKGYKVSALDSILQRVYPEWFKVNRDKKYFFVRTDKTHFSTEQSESQDDILISSDLFDSAVIRGGVLMKGLKLDLKPDTEYRFIIKEL